MAIRRLLTDNDDNTALQESLLRGDAFSYAHLVKFEKPLKTKQGDSRGQAVDYIYVTDGSQDISFDDGSTYEVGNTIQSNGAQTYVANKLLKVGGISEAIEARASNINITMAGAALGISFQSILNITSSNTITSTISFVEEGFREGDDIQIMSSNPSAANDNIRARIDRFSNNNLTAHVTPSYKNQTDSQGDVTPLFVTSLTAQNGILYSVNYNTAAVESVLDNRAAGTYARYINRDIFIYKAHIDLNGQIIGAPFLIFKGIIATGKLTENPEKGTTVSWGLTSHWGDFVRVNGRLTSDPHHRALDGEGQTDPDALKRADYENDLGFLHSEQAINLIANYDVAVTKTRLKKKKKWLGLKTDYSQQEYTVMEERETDLRFNLDAKYLPVVYGVGKIPGIPVFVDTLNTDNSVIFTAYALSEGEIGGIYDIHFDGTPSVCIDENDFDTRSTKPDNGTTDVVCYGRADRGDTLDSKTVLTGSGFRAGSHGGAQGAVDWGETGGYAGVGPGRIAYRDYASIGYNETSPTAASASTQGAGITHEKGTFFDVPIDTQLQFFSGKPNQKASSLLTQNKANFKIGTSYYSGSSEYWGDNHTLLDTAYAVCKFTISEGEVTIPTPEFIVRGKAVDCYNYDYSYELHSTHTSANLSTYNIGDEVILRDTATNATLDVSTNIIADIYYITALSGTQEARVRLRDKPTLTITAGSTVNKITSFYLQKTGAGRIYLRTYDDVEDSGTIGEKLETTISSGTANSGNDGADITLVGTTSSSFKAGLDLTDAGVAIHENGGGAGQTFGRSLVSDYRIFNHATNSNTITNIGATGVNASSLANKKVTLKNVVKLDKDPVGGGPGKWFKLKKKWPDNSTPAGAKKKRKGFGIFKILTKDTTNKLLSLAQVIDASVVPDTNDSYEVLSSNAEDGPEDTRVTLNPAMHLLDYLTSDRYGRELDIDKDIDLESFLEAARDCDTRADVTMVTTTSLNEDEEYVYAPSAAGGKVLWYGVVRSSTQIATGRYNTVFTKVSGKMAYRWENWKYFYTGELYYYQGALHQASSNGIISNTPSTTKSVSAVNLTKKGTSTTVGVEIAESRATFDGNPVVKKGLNTTARSSETGYSLYDSDDVKYWRFVGWDAQNQRHVTRHQLNTVIDTSRPVFQNVNDLLNQFNGILRYSAGKYSLAIKKGYEDPTTKRFYYTDATKTVLTSNVTSHFEDFVIDNITEDDIVGNINIEDAGLKGSFNSVSVSIEDPQNKFEGRSISLFNSTYLKQDKGIKKDGNISTPDITNYYNARIAAKQFLDQSRAALKINFTMSPKGLLHSAGDIIRITYPRFNWTNKHYRITNLTFNENCLVQVTAEEHEDNAFLIIPERASIKGVDSLTGNSAAPVRPTNLSATANKRGGIQLDWVNSTTFDPTFYTVEIYRSEINNREDTSHLPPTNANGGKPFLQLIGTSKSDTYTDPILEDGLVSRYYWIRYNVIRQQRRIAGVAPRQVFSNYEPLSATGAAVGSAAGAVDGISISMSNDNATILADENGNPTSFANTGTAIKVFISGSAPIPYDNSSPYQNNSFRIASATASGVTAGAATEGSNVYSQANISAMPGDTGTITYSIIVKDAIGVEKTFEKIQTFTKSKRGEFGKTVELIASKYVINYSEDGTETDSLTFDATARNFGSTVPYFQFFVDNNARGTPNTGTGTPQVRQHTLADSDEPGIGGTKTIKVQVRADGVSGDIVAEDSVSIYGIQDGSDAITGFLTNPSHTVGANTAGASNVGAAGGEFRVFVGGTNVTSSCTFSIVSGSESGVTMSIGANSGIYTVSSFPNSSISGVSTFRATIPAATAKTASPVTVDQVYSISKAKEGVAGDNAKVVHLDATDYSVVYDQSGANPSFTSPSGNSNVVRFTASAQGYTSPEYKFTVDGAAGSFSSTNTHDITYSGTSFSTSDAKDVVKVEVREGSSGSATAEDSVAVVKVRSGSNALTTHEVVLYQAQAAGQNYANVPADPTSAVYNFSTHLFTSGLGSWTQTFPQAARNQLVWAISASPQTSAEITSSTTVTLSASDFSPAIIVENPNGINICYKYHSSGTTPPSITGQTALGATFADGIPSGWYDTPAIAAQPSNKSSSQTFLWQSSGSVLDEYTDVGGFRATARARWIWLAPKRLDGSDAYTVILSNESHSFPSENNGNVSSTTGSGTLVEVIRGGTTLTGILTGEPSADQFKVVASGTNITPSSSRGSSVSGGLITYNDHTAGTIMAGASNTTAEIEYTITISTGDTQQVVKKKQSFTKSIKGDDGTPAQNVREPTIFRKNNNSINSTSGTFADPLNGNSSWGFAVPAITANGDKVYAATRIFTSDGNAPQQSNWSSPAVAFERIDGNTITGPAGVGTRQVNLYKLNDSSFSTTTAGTFANPTNGTESGWTFAVPALTSNNDKVYVVSRIFTSDGNSPQESSWSSPAVYAQRQDGEDAQNQRMPTIYRKNSASISSTAGTFADPLNGNSGWSFSVPGISANGDVIYASSRLFTSDGQSPQDSSWSTPAIAFRRVDGATVTGPAGQSGRTVNLYRKNSNTRNSTSGSFSDPRNGNTSWSFSVPSLTANGDIVYVMSRTFTSDGASPQDSSWSTGTVYSRRTDGANGTSVSITSVSPNTPSTGTTRVTFSNGSTMDVDDGQNGADGDGVDVVYRNASSNPGTPSPSSGAPSGWSFTASSPSAGQRTYVSLGTRNNNAGNYTWQYPSQLTGVDGQDGQDGEDGEDGTDGTNAYAAVCDRPAVFFSEVNNSVSPSGNQAVTFTFSDGSTSHSKSFNFSANGSTNTITASGSSGASQISYDTGFGMRSSSSGQLIVKVTHSTSGLKSQSAATFITIKGN